jgi:hypothetical protein
MKIYVNKNGQQSGPYTQEQLQQYLAMGELAAEDLAWHEGLPEWVTVGALVNPAGVPAPPMPPGGVQPQEGGISPKIKLAVRIVLIVVLVGVAALVGLDHLGRVKYEKAYEYLDGRFNEGGTTKPSAVAMELGRKPTSTSQEGMELTEVYQWAGTVRAYRIRVKYSVRMAEDVELMEVRAEKRWRLVGDWK